MKISMLLSSKAWMAFVISITGLLLLSSCGKDDDITPEPVGPAKVKYVNTVQGSASQDLYVNDTKKSTEPVAYGNASAYLDITSGVNVFKVQDAGTTTVNATSQAYQIPIGIYFSIFYHKLGTGAYTAFAIEDNMSAPTAGKAKVRFFNLNSFLSTSTPISISTVGQTEILVPKLEYGQASIYFEVNPGAQFTFTATGVTSAPVFNGGIVAGKNYTIWIDGASATSLAGHAILQN